MAFIHVKRIGGKKYYTLRISVRKGSKVVTKDLESLGSDLSKIDLKTLEKKYKKEIRKSYHSIKKFLDSNYYLQKAKAKKIKKDSYLGVDQQYELEAIKNHYRTKFLKADKLTKAEVLENHFLNFAVNSTSIEGNTITLKEARKLFDEDMLPKNKTLREVYDLQNTKKTMLFLRNNNPVMTLELFVQVHDMLLERIDARSGFRNHDIKIFGQPFKPSPARYIKADLELLIDWYKKHKNKLHPLVLATLFHHKFEKIHPFSDGNGRAGRVLVNHILYTLNYPPLVISRRFRHEYLDEMNRADACIKKSFISMDFSCYKKLIAFFCSQYVSSYWDTFLL